MKRMTSCSEIAFWISSRMGLVVLPGLLRLGDEGQGMDGAADVGPEHRVDTAVLLDAAQPGELGGDDRGPEVVARAREIGHVGLGAGDRGLDALLEIVRRGHLRRSVAAATLWEALAGHTTGSASHVITFSDKGAEKVQEFLASQTADIQTSGLRVGVRGGGCSGFQYALAFDTQREGDEVFEDHGLRILVDGPSLPYVRGAVVDYVEGLQGAGFKVDNPNVIAACGCGSSFRGAEEEEVSAGCSPGWATARAGKRLRHDPFAGPLPGGARRHARRLRRVGVQDAAPGEEDARRVAGRHARREAAARPGDRDHRGEPELHLPAGRVSRGAARVRPLGARGRRHAPRLLPPAARLALARAAAGEDELRRAQRGLPARHAAVRAVQGPARPARGARGAAEARRLAGLGGDRRHAGLGGAPAVRL